MRAKQPPRQKKGSKNEKIKPQKPWKGLFPRISAVFHCINFGVAMFPYACGYFPDKRLKSLSLKFAPKLTLGCIVSNCGTQANLEIPGSPYRTVPNPQYDLEVPGAGSHPARLPPGQLTGHDPTDNPL